MTKYLLPILVVSLIIIFVIRYLSSSTPTATPTSISIPTSSPLAGLQTNPPWIAETDYLKQRLSQLNLPALKSEGTALHTHQHLDIFIDGKKLEIPTHIGIGPNDSYISTIHTHDTAGIIHVESPTIDDFYLGQFFDIWGLRFTNNCLGSYCNSESKKLQLFVNGQEITTDFRQLKLLANQEIVVTFGTPQDLPKTIPSKYSFPAGY